MHKNKYILLIVSVCALVFSADAAINCPNGITVATTPQGSFTPAHRVLSEGSQQIQYNCSVRVTENGDPRMTVWVQWFDPLATQTFQIFGGPSSYPLTPSTHVTKTLTQTRTINVPSPSTSWTITVAPWIDIRIYDCNNTSQRFNWSHVWTNQSSESS